MRYRARILVEFGLGDVDFEGMLMMGEEPVRDLGKPQGELPDSLTLEQAFQAAYFMIEKYIVLEKTPVVELVLLEQYMMSDPARWSDWLDSVRRALAHPEVAVEYLYDWRRQFGRPDGVES